MNHLEREEMKRRTLTMMLYLLRSPFYDRYSKLAHLIADCYYILVIDAYPQIPVLVF